MHCWHWFSIDALPSCSAGVRHCLLIFSLGSPAAGFLLFGRHVLGDIPALAFFFGGCWAWLRGLKRDKLRYLLLSGSMFGAAIVTKTQYLLMIVVTLLILLMLDLLYYHLQLLKPIFVVGSISVLFFLAWTAWQIYYLALIHSTATTFSDLAAVTTGFTVGTTVQALDSADQIRFFTILGLPCSMFCIYAGDEIRTPFP
jgi:hypothetical protein